MHKRRIVIERVTFPCLSTACDIFLINYSLFLGTTFLRVSGTFNLKDVTHITFSSGQQEATLMIHTYSGSKSTGCHMKQVSMVDISYVTACTARIKKSNRSKRFYPKSVQKYIWCKLFNEEQAYQCGILFTNQMRIEPVDVMSAQPVYCRVQTSTALFLSSWNNNGATVFFATANSLPFLDANSIMNFAFESWFFVPLMSTRFPWLFLDIGFFWDHHLSPMGRF